MLKKEEAANKAPAVLEKARKAEKLSAERAAKVENLYDLKDQGNIWCLN